MNTKVLSEKDEEVYKLVKRISDGNLKKEVAANVLNISRRRIDQLLSKYKKLQ